MRRFVIVGMVGAFLVLGTVLSADACGRRHRSRCFTPATCCEPTDCCVEETACCPDPCCQSTCRVNRCNTRACFTPRFRKARFFRTATCCEPTTCCEPVSSGCCDGGTLEGGTTIEEGTPTEVDVEEAPAPTI